MIDIYCLQKEKEGENMADVKNDVYLYGMILITNSFLLKNRYPEADTYGEIRKKYVLPGGETGTAATILSGLGCNVIMDGTYLGTKTYPLIYKFYKDKTVDISGMYIDPNFEGLEDYVMIDKDTRTPFGTFESFYTDAEKRWHDPKEADILTSKVVGLDPWFGDCTQKVINICKKHSIPYVTIDCPYYSDVHRNASINILSNEFLSPNYKNIDRNELFQKYIDHTEGLVIFTLGSKDIIYGRKGENPKHFKPYSVPVISTLGAGDTFKAGCIYALLHQMDDDSTIRFAAAAAACACTLFPLPLNPPSLDMITEQMNHTIKFSNLFIRWVFNTYCFTTAMDSVQQRLVCHKYKYICGITFFKYL